MTNEYTRSVCSEPVPVISEPRYSTGSMLDPDFRFMSREMAVYLPDIPIGQQRIACMTSPKIRLITRDGKRID